MSQTMKIKIYFTVNGVEDFFIVEANTLEECQDEVVKECTKRNLHSEHNNMYSIELNNEYNTNG